MNLPKDVQNIVVGYLEQVPTDIEKLNKRRVMEQIKWNTSFFDHLNTRIMPSVIYTMTKSTILPIEFWKNCR